VKKVVLIISMLSCVCLHSMDRADRFKNSLSTPKNSPKRSPKPSKKLTDSDGGRLSPQRPVSSIDELKKEIQIVKDEKRNPSEQK